TISGGVGSGPPVPGGVPAGPCPLNTANYNAGGAEANDLTVTRDANSNYTFTEAGSVTITAPTPECTVLSTHSVRCPIIGAQLNINLGDQNDQLHLNGAVNTKGACGL